MLAYSHTHKLKMSNFVDLTIYEKNHDVGGTWLENRYPGIAWYVCNMPFWKWMTNFRLSDVPAYEIPTRMLGLKTNLFRCLCLSLGAEPRLRQLLRDGSRDLGLYEKDNHKIPLRWAHKVQLESHRVYLGWFYVKVARQSRAEWTNHPGWGRCPGEWLWHFEVSKRSFLIDMITKLSHVVSGSGPVLKDWMRSRANLYTVQPGKTCFNIRSTNF